ncbi:hypothetical protein FRC12_017850 [Ceratobasidium sp. 428]|nr:hypothetical protein FRC12_017850 [Ceratobasidium sp. 428]
MPKKEVIFKVEQSILKAQAGGSTPAGDTTAFTESDQEEYESEDDWQDANPNALLVFALRRPFPPMVETFQFPSIASLLENDVDADPFEALFDEVRDDIEEAIRNWWLRVEDELLEAFLAGSDVAPCSDLALNFPLPPKYASAVSDLSPFLRTLLRADTVFRAVNDRVCPSPLYYPEMFSMYQQRFGGHFRSRSGIDPRLGYVWNTDRVRRFDEGVAAAKAILDELGRKDAAQFEMQCLGAIFACGQCSDKMSRTWNQIVHHHAEALSRAHAYEQCTDPIKSSTTYNDPHTISSGPRPRGKSKPLVIVYTPEKAKTLYPKHQDLTSVVQCNLCSQLGVRFVGSRSVVLKHAKAVHSVVNPKANVYTTTDQEDPDWHWTPRRWERVSESSGETDVPTGRDLASKVDYYGARAYWTDFKHRSTRRP